VPVTPRKISDIKPLLTNLAQTSHYEVRFGTLPIPLMSYLRSKGVDTRFIAESAGLLCFSASLPTTQLASFTIDGNYMGIQEKFAHSRQYDAISLDFYVDSDYRMLKFLECWMEFIASGSSVSQNLDGYFARIQYPAYYKTDQVRIIKFDRDYRKEVEYNFKGLFPASISSIPVSYVNTDVLKVSASFSYDRYIAGKTLSFDQSIVGDNNNLDPLTTKNRSPSSPQSADELVKQTKETIQFPPPNPQPLTDQANALTASFTNIRVI
jgi:hypothetical protein